MPDPISPPSIKHKNELSPSQDYYFLRKEGIRLVQDLAGKIWTDYNEHDPGVTILEQLCFALTDIAYRTNIELPRLLFSEGDQERIALNNGFFAPEDVLLTSQVTLQDHKILFLDKLTGINNIWFGTSQGPELRGLYDVYVQPMVHHHPESNDIEHRVRTLFAEYRCISEDIGRVVILKPETIEIEMQIDLYEDSSVEETIAEMYYQLEAYFNHKVQYCSFEDLRKQGLGYEQIFERPSFDKKRGFLNSLCMEENPTVFSFSKINTLISKLKGIRRVSDLVIRKNGIQVTGEQVQIDDGCFVTLSTDINPNYVIAYKNHIRVDYNIEKIKALYLQKVAEDKKMHLFKSTIIEPIEAEHYFDLSNYQSVQNTFPITYGIGTYGLPSDAGTERILQARQLQGYLLFFDQMLINHLAQLKHLSQLFSFGDDHPQKTYFYDYPHHISNIDELVSPTLRQKLGSLQEDDYADRKNKCLDHLLARFGEKFVDETLHNLQNIYGIGSKEELSACLVRLKSSLLKQYRLLSQHRNKAYNYYYPTWNGTSMYTGQRNDRDLVYAYPFKKKMFLLMNLNIANEGMVSLLGDSTSLKVRELGDGEPNELQQKEEQKQAKGTPLTKVTFVLPNTPQVLEHLTYYGAKQDHYAVVRTEDEQKWQLVFQASENQPAMVLGVFRGKLEADQVMAKLIAKFKAIHQKSEGFHVVEHLLLRPLLEEQFELVIILNANKTNFLTSIYGNTYEEQKILLSEVMIYGGKKQHYVCAERLHKEHSRKDVTSYSIILQDPHGNDLMRLNQEYHSKELAEAYIEQQLVPFFKKLGQEKYAIPASAQLKPLHNYDAKTNMESLKTHYDAQVSLVLPSWLPRFNEPDFRLLFRKSLCSCLPAHIKVNEVWLDKKQMEQFEKDYKQWMVQKAKVLHSTSNPKFAQKDARVKYRNELNQQREDKVQLDKLALVVLRNLLNRQ